MDNIHIIYLPKDVHVLLNYCSITLDYCLSEIQYSQALASFAHNGNKKRHNCYSRWVEIYVSTETISARPLGDCCVLCTGHRLNLLFFPAFESTLICIEAPLGEAMINFK